MTAPIVEIAALVKSYGALRPLRLERLSLAQGEHVALMGLDQPAAEVFVSLVTGASLPDQGEVVVFGRNTRTIADSTDFLSALDRFGIVSERAAFLESLTVIQNLSVPFTLEIEPPLAEIRDKALALAREAGLDERTADRPAGELDAAARLRLRVARALALDPSLLLVEHPSATLSRNDVHAMAAAVREIVKRRGLTALTVTMDRDYASAGADRVLTLEPSTGRLTDRRPGRMRFWS